MLEHDFLCAVSEEQTWKMLFEQVCLSEQGDEASMACSLGRALAELLHELESR